MDGILNLIESVSEGFPSYFFSKTYTVRPVTLYCMVELERYIYLAHNPDKILCRKNPVARPKVNVTVRTLPVCEGSGETCLCPARYFVLHCGI